MLFSPMTWLESKTGYSKLPASGENLILFVSKKKSNNAVTPQSAIVLIALVNDQWSLTKTMSTFKLCSITPLFGFF